MDFHAAANNKVYDAVAPAWESRLKQMRDLGFDEPEAFPGGGHGDVEEKFRELSEELEGKRAEVAELRQALETAKVTEAKSTQKLQSFQQVNRSQSALVRAELNKCRRKLAHTQAVASRLHEQAEWLKAQQPGLSLPGHLHGLPSEEDAAEEAAELLQMHRRWENDILQLQAELQDPSKGSKAKELEEARQTVAELKAALQRQEREAASKQPKKAESAAVPGDGEAASRQELQAAEEKSKEQLRKLRQLATAYKKLEQEKAEGEQRLAAALKELEAATAREGASAPAPSATSAAAAAIPLQRLLQLQQAAAETRNELVQLRDAVKAELTQRLPSLLAEAAQAPARLAELQQLLAAGAQAAAEWREKYELESVRRRKLHNLVQELRGNIRVYCRVRPLAAHESGSCISFPSADEIQIRNEATGMKKTWQFNEVFKEDSSQASVFAGIRDLVTSMMDGFNVCIFAYGQTGAGKTHSMQGTKENPGIYTRTFNELFKVAQERSGWKVELKGALVEIYNEEIRDLLVPSGDKDKRAKLTVRQGKEGNHVPGLTLLPVATTEDVDALLATGQENRTVAATDMNMHSSRSHLLVQIHCSATTSEGKQLTSCITLVDLAGSERLAKSGVSGDRAKEAIAINKSLSALGDVINARATKNAHTPFRNSQLTHLLQDSLSGDSKTLMLLQINPCQDHVEESLCSLTFGARVNAVEMSKK